MADYAPVGSLSFPVRSKRNGGFPEKSAADYQQQAQYCLSMFRHDGGTKQRNNTVMAGCPQTIFNSGTGAAQSGAAYNESGKHRNHSERSCRGKHPCSGNQPAFSGCFRRILPVPFRPISSAGRQSWNPADPLSDQSEEKV